MYIKLTKKTSVGKRKLVGATLPTKPLDAPGGLGESSASTRQPKTQKPLHSPGSKTTGGPMRPLHSC